MTELSNEMSSQEWRQLIHTPVASVDHAFTPGAVAAVCMYADNSQAALVAGLARSNDIKSLQVFLEHPVYATGAKELSPKERETLCYSVAHMLVDGGPNVEFAKKWMEHFVHTPDKASERVRTLLETPLATVEEMQHLLGVLSVAPNPFKVVNAGDTKGPAIEKIFNLPSGMPFEAGKALAKTHLLCEVLQMHSPHELPDLVKVNINIELLHGDHSRVSGVEEKTPLAHAMWEDKDGASRFLPVVAEAYGTANPNVVVQMRRGFNAALENGTLPLGMRSEQESLILNVIGQGWMDPAEVEKMWLCQYGIYKHNAGKWEKTPSDFCDMVGAIAERAPQVAVQLVQTMDGQGVDMSKRLIRAFGFDKHSYGLLDVAVEKACPELYGALLAVGADPAKPNWKSVASNPRTREPSSGEKIDTMIETLEAQDRDNPRLERLRAMKEVTNAWRAQKAARDVLSELDLGSTALKP